MPRCIQYEADPYEGSFCGKPFLAIISIALVILLSSCSFPGPSEKSIDDDQVDVGVVSASLNEYEHSTYDDAAIIVFEWTNHSGRDASFAEVAMIRAYQEGVMLHSVSERMNRKDIAKNDNGELDVIQDSVSHQFTMVYAVRDPESPIQIKVYSLLSSSEDNESSDALPVLYEARVFLK